LLIRANHFRVFALPYDSQKNELAASLQLTLINSIQTNSPTLKIVRILTFTQVRLDDLSKKFTIMTALNLVALPKR
jgi:hypothetical protein